MQQDYKHPITPPPELVQEWNEEAEGTYFPRLACSQHITNRAAQWGADQQLKLDAEQIEKAYQAGADQELEACCELMDDWGLEASDLRAARRPKPPSLKEQALDLLDKAEDPSWDINDFTIVRRALEALPND